ncbi:ATP-binding protein [Nanoarchaeota archaeon]
MKGQVISGRFGEIKVRQKAGQEIELGELLVSDSKEGKIIMQVYDLVYGSQISEQNLELISGMKLEEGTDMDFMDPELRNYTIAYLKNLITVQGDKAGSSKALPEFFSTVRSVKEDDLKFITQPKCPLYLGSLRSGTKELNVKLYLPGDQVLSHHILITGTTGKGKSVLMSNLIWDVTTQDYAAMLVLDPHDEYYGRNKLGLKDHPGKVIYYTSQNAPPGTRTLKINLKQLRPEHFGFLGLSQPQNQALNVFFREYGKDWIEAIILEKPIKLDFHEATTAVLKRRMTTLLDLDFQDNQLFCNSIFDIKAGETTISDIVKELEDAKTVIIDTSNFSGQVELLVGSLITTELFRKYKHYKMTGELKGKPVINIVLEEAPRVLGKDVLETGSNIFSTLAREGRKFKVGLTAITQLPSLIPREILANINTKIILGTEMNTERRAIIESASQDLSSDDRNIASLDKGEAIVSSNFARFALPVKIPFFDAEVKKLKADKVKKKYEGVV